MVTPNFGGKILANAGYAILNGESQPDITYYPRAKGALIRPSNIIEKEITLNGCFWKFPNAANLTDIEGYQHTLIENLTNIGNATLIVNGVSFHGCSPKSITSTKVLNKIYQYDLSFDVGVQNDYSDFDTTNTSQLSGYPDFKQMRNGYFQPTGMNRFYFGQQVEQLKDGEWINIKEKEATWAKEFNFTSSGGLETINLKGWIVDATRKQMMTFMYNAIMGPLGKLGTLNIGGDSTTLAFFKSINMEKPIGRSFWWNAVFITSVKC